jgi:hypothetical protein
MAKGIRKVGFAVVLSFALGTCASAQTRGGFGARGTGGLARASSVSSGASRGFAAPRRTIIGTAPGIFRPGLFPRPIVGTPLNPNFAPIRGVPGLGFDYQHLAAIEHPFPNRFGRGRGLVPFYPYFAPIFLNTLPLDYDAYYGSDEYPYGYDNAYPPYGSAVPDYYTQQPQFMIPQPGAVAPAENAPSAAPPAPVPPPELGQLILVRRDGKVLLAVAFTVRNGDLTYVTTEGTRRSFPVSELDKEATRQMNDANGTSVSLPD